MEGVSNGILVRPPSQSRHPQLAKVGSKKKVFVATGVVVEIVGIWPEADAGSIDESIKRSRGWRKSEENYIIRQPRIFIFEIQKPIMGTGACEFTVSWI